MFKGHITGRISIFPYFHIPNSLLSRNSIKLSKFCITFFKSQSTTLINGTKYHKKSENFVQLKDGHACYYKEIFIFSKLTLFGENFEFLKFCLDVLTRIPNKKKFSQINFCEYRSFIIRKTLNFIMFVETLACSMHTF